MARTAIANRAGITLAAITPPVINVINGTELADALVGGNDIDQIFGLGGDDILTGNGAGDILDGGSGDDNLYGNIGPDTLYGGLGTDTLYGGQGPDILDGGSGADRMVGDLGDDTFYVDSKRDVVVEAKDQGTDTVYSSVSYSLVNQWLENITLTGSAKASATGNLIANVIIGNSGNNKIDGGLGADSMTGGLGNDTYYVDDAGDLVIEDAAGGVRDAVFSTISIATLYDNVESLTLTGIAAINGGGNGLANRMTGNEAANNLAGGDGDDQIDGGLGGDLINGNAGRDTLTGGDGGDTFLFDQLEASGAIFDRIKDFDRLEGDKIALAASAFGAIGATLDVGELVIGKAALDANDFLILDAAGGKLYYDADGNGAGVKQLIAVLDGVTTLSESDFAIML